MALSDLMPLMFTLWLLGVVGSDLRSRKVYNSWIVIGILGWIVGVVYYKAPLLDGIVALLIAIAVLIPFYAMGWMGAGDVKFGMVLGAWFGVSSGLLVVWLGGSLLAGVHAVCLLFWNRLKGVTVVQGILVSLRLGGYLLKEGKGNQSGLFSSDSVRRLNGISLPYAGYMAVAAICCLWYEYI